MAAAATPEIVALLRGRGIGTGTIGDIGCGAGVSTRCFLDAGYDVWALEPSRALLELARGAAPGAEFLPPASIYDSELPPADALVALSEPLTYHAPGSDADKRVLEFFSRAATLLRAGGLLVFDVIVGAGPVDRLPRFCVERAVDGCRNTCFPVEKHHISTADVEMRMRGPWI